MRDCKGCGATFIKGETECPYCGASLIPGDNREGAGKRPQGPEPRPADAGEKHSGKRDGTAREKKRRDTRPDWDTWVPPLNPPGEPPPLKMFQKKSNLVAMVLAFTLGIFGAHWYYMGNPGRAKWYLFFFWTGIPLLIGILDGFFFLHKFLSEDLTLLP